jgi:flagellar hook-length control protein FliK
MNAGTVLPGIPLSVNEKTGSQTPTSTRFNSPKFIFGDVLKSSIADSTEALPNVEIVEMSENQLAAFQEIIQLLNTDQLADLENGEQVVSEILADENTSLASLLTLLGIDNPKEEETISTILNASQEQLGEDEEINSIENSLYLVVSQALSLNDDQLLELDLDEMTTIFTLAKTQELIAPYQDLTLEETEMNSELKQMLQSMLTRLTSLVEKTQQTSEGSTVKTTGSFQVHFSDMVTGLRLATPNHLVNELNSRSTHGSEAGLTNQLIMNQNKSSENNNHDQTGTKPFVSAQMNALETAQNTYTRLFGELNMENEKKATTGVPLKLSDQSSMSQTLPQQITKLEQFMLTVEKSGQPVNQQQFIKAFENILSKANFSGENGMQKLLIRLNPEHLGSLRIEIIQKDQVMIAKILATTVQAKELLENQANSLRQSFASQGIQVEKIEISQQMNLLQSDRFFQKDADSSGQQHNKRSKEENSSEDEVVHEFFDTFEEALLNIEV